MTPEGQDAFAVTLPCPRCRNNVRPGAKFCDDCGTPLLAAAPEPTFPADGELKFVTVLFSDIVGSTGLVAGHPAENAQMILTPAVKAMASAVQAFGGSLNNVLGDGVMALFGVPLSQEDHAARACSSAIRMHEAVALLDPPVQLRVGIASGQTLLSTLNAAVAGAYSAFGVTIHIAARMQAMALPGTTLCAASTQALTGPSVRMVSLGPQTLRGLGVQQAVFALTGVDQGGLRFGGPVARGLSAYVGRETEVAALAYGAQAIVAGASAVILIIGDAGAGKSRLAWEFTRALPRNTWRIVQAEAVSYGRDVPYQLVGTLLRSALEIDARDDADASVSRLRGRVKELHCPPGTAPALLSLLSLPLGTDAEPWDRLDSMSRRNALRDGVAALLDALALREPILLLVEDLQWADEESLRLLDLTPSPGARVLLMGTHRPDFVSRWTGMAPDRITLQPLTAACMGQLLNETFPGIESAALRQALIERSAGNPFFLEELSRDALVESAGDQEPGIPSTIQSVVAARIDRLESWGRRVLITASALGNLFSLRTLRALFRDYPQQAFEERVQGLCDAGMLRPVRELNDEIRFAHALFQEVAYAGLTRTKRRTLHRQIVLAIKRLHPSDWLADQAETLVYHASLGEVWDELGIVAGFAGRRAASRSAYVEAARFFKQGIDACRKSPQTPQMMAREIDLRFDLRASLFPTAGISQSLANSSEAARLAGQMGDRNRTGWATAYVARDLQLVGRPGEAMATAARALEYAGDDHELIVVTKYFSAHAAYAQGDYARAAAILRTLVIELHARDPTAWTGTPGPSAIFFRCWLVWSLARLGNDEEALATAAAMRNSADEWDMPLCQTVAHLSEGFALAHAGRLTEAHTTLEVSLALCRRWELFAWSTNIMSCLGHVKARLGQVEEGIGLLEQAIARTTASGILVSHANELAWLAEAHLLAGRTAEARDHAENAATVARQHEEVGNEAFASLVLAEALAAHGNIGESQAQFAIALRMAKATGMMPLVRRGAAQLTDRMALCGGRES